MAACILMVDDHSDIGAHALESEGWRVVAEATHTAPPLGSARALEPALAPVDADPSNPDGNALMSRPVTARAAIPCE
jgi:hypothetical protein